jgi:hypothetical protein
MTCDIFDQQSISQRYEDFRVLEIGLDDGKGAFQVVVRLHYFFF